MSQIVESRVAAPAIASTTVLAGGLATASERLMPHLGAYRFYRKHLSIMTDYRLTDDFRFDRRHPYAKRERALELWRSIPPPAVLDPAREMLDRAVNERAPFEDIAAIVSGMLEAKPNYKAEARAAYMGILIDVLDFEADLEPISRAAAATAAYRTLTENKFVPEIAEFLALIGEQRQLFERASEIVARLDENRERAGELLALYTGDITREAWGLDPEVTRDAV